MATYNKILSCKFNEGAGSTAYDATGNGYDGVITGTTNGSISGTYYSLSQYSSFWNYRYGAYYDGTKHVPALEDGSEAADGSTINRPSGRWVNNQITTFNFPLEAELITSDAIISAIYGERSTSFGLELVETNTSVSGINGGIKGLFYDGSKYHVLDSDETNIYIRVYNGDAELMSPISTPITIDISSYFNKLVYSICLDGDGNYYVLGRSPSLSDYIVKYDSAGTFIAQYPSYILGVSQSTATFFDGYLYGIDTIGGSLIKYTISGVGVSKIDPEIQFDTLDETYSTSTLVSLFVLNGQMYLLSGVTNIAYEINPATLKATGDRIYLFDGVNDIIGSTASSAGANKVALVSGSTEVSILTVVNTYVSGDGYLFNAAGNTQKDITIADANLDVYDGTTQCHVIFSNNTVEYKWKDILIYSRVLTLEEYVKVYKYLKNTITSSSLTDNNGVNITDNNGANIKIYIKE